MKQTNKQKPFDNVPQLFVKQLDCISIFVSIENNATFFYYFAENINIIY